MNSIFKTIALISAAMAGFVIPAAAQSSEALPFISIERDPVTSAMAGAGVASPSSTSFSAFRNAAAVAFAGEKMDFAVSTQAWTPDAVRSSNINASYNCKFGERFSLSVAGAYQMGEEYDVTDVSGIAQGTYRPSDVLFGVGAGYRITSDFGVGVNLKYASSKVADHTSFGAFAADVFLQYKFADFSVAAGMANIGSKVKAYDGTSYDIPAAAVVGFNYSFKSGKNAVQANADVDYYVFSSNYAAAIGAEYGYGDMVFVRAGYRYANEGAVMPSFASAGLGVKFLGIKVDLSYLTLDNSMCLGVSYAF